MDDRLARTIGTATRAARVARKLTQEDAADLVGISLEFYARIERGKTLPSVGTLLKISTGLHVAADVLLGIDTLSDAARARLEAAADPEAAITRRLVRRIQRAKPSAIRLVNLLLIELETTPAVGKRKHLALVTADDATRSSRAADSPRSRK
jgi:transcriptional regulator with XRE-family HTH domain